MASSDVVVYVPNSETFADSNGTVHLARIIQQQAPWVVVQLLTDSHGAYAESPSTVTLSDKYVLSYRETRNIEPRTFYQFAAYSAEGIQYPLTASGFVQTKTIEKPLSSTTRNGLGSGLYGIFVVGDLARYRSTPDQTVYSIECPDAYPLQDAEQGDAITNASLQTNRYLERILEIVRADDDPSYPTVSALIAANSLSDLVMLWNLALFRTGDRVTEEGLRTVLATYISNYFTETPLIDSVTGEALQPQPINSILQSLGYDGIIATDAANNGWDRGCVCYRYETAEILQGSITPYSTGDVGMNGSK